MKKIKKIKEKLNKNIVLGISLLALGLVTGIGILSTGYNILASVNPFNLVAGDVTYSSSSTSKNNVQDSIDELYNKVSTWIDPDNFGIQLNSAKTVMATPGGICIKRNGTVYCFGTNNWSYEKDHIQSVFSDISCNVDSVGVDCDASDFSCYVRSGGYVRCYDQSGYSYCRVRSDGSVKYD